jgi:hypothetical protein
MLGELVSVSLLGALMILPWHMRIVRQFLLTLVDQVGEKGAPGVYNRLPWAYLSYGWERVWFGLAAAGLLLAAGWRLWAVVRAPRVKGSGRAGIVVMLGVWVAAVTGLMNVDRLGVPTFGLINNNSWVISLFVPVGIVLGWLADLIWRAAAHRQWTRAVARAGLGAAVVWTGLYGIRQNIAIMNPETVLASDDDMALIGRSISLLPDDALVLVNSWAWLGEDNWAGSDAGYWILPLTGRQTTMPPIGYGMDRGNFDLVNGFNEAVAQIDDWGAPETLDRLRRHGVTHVFIGARGGALRPELLLDDPHYRLLDTNGAAWLFALDFDPSS